MTGTGVSPRTPWERLDRFDGQVDTAFDRLRGIRWADGAAVVVSNLADYGLVWVLLAGLKARRAGPSRSRAVQALAVAGFSSVVVNAGLKALVGRSRPGTAIDQNGGRLPVRAPRSTSFPSGHTLAAFCTAVVLSDGPVQRAAFLGFASAVAVSRVHLQAHHASDVVAGAAVGVAVGCAGRRALGGGHRQSPAR